MAQARFRKGQLVRVVRGRPLLSLTAVATTRLTDAERTEMYDLPYYRGMGDDGEGRLVPHFVHTHPVAGSLLTVVRARAAYPEPSVRRKGYVLALSTDMGREIWIHETLLEPLEPE